MPKTRWNVGLVYVDEAERLLPQALERTFKHLGNRRLVEYEVVFQGVAAVWSIHPASDVREAVGNFCIGWMEARNLARHPPKPPKGVSHASLGN